ncbi:MAG: hypothetical protein AB7S80_14990 [Rhizobiaceae bacterium]
MAICAARGNLGELDVVKTFDSTPTTALIGRPLIDIRDMLLETGRTLLAQKLV